MFPNLEKLRLGSPETEILNEIWLSQSSAVPFPNLNSLTLHGSEDHSWGVLPFDIHKYQNLERIYLEGFSFMKNLWQPLELGAAEEYNGRMLTRLTTLYLENLPMLMHLFEVPEDFQALQNLETLEVDSCGRLKTLLMSPSVTFQNLGELRISKCHGMINVLASSTVKCLVQLKTMSIYECDQMTEIIADKEGEPQSTEIAFTQLETLALHRLPTLKSFYCGNSNMKFPNLEKVIVSECPQMENFSRGTVITSKLNTLITRIEWYEYRRPENVEGRKNVWKGDLNTSVRMVWEDLHNSTKVIL